MPGGKTGKHLDETACGPLCQHPLCWASNRRVERGLPRLVDTGKKNSETYSDDLPTLKIVDMFGGLPEAHNPGRSSSAPLLANVSCGTTPVKSPLTPTVSPAVNLSASFSKGKKQPLKPPPLKKIEVHEIVDWPEDWSDNFVGSHFYLWCSRNDPSKRKGQMDTKFIQSTGCLSSSHPDHVHIKDVTEDMLPSSMKTRDKKQKTKKHASYRTPTGGRPYTHPSRGQVPRSYVKSPREDEISQLLSLPREVLLQVIEHANNSDIYDKNRVHTLLEKVLPQIHFQQHILARQKQLEKNRNAAGTPLEESGILQNKKVQLKEGPKQTMEQSLPITKTSFLDGNVAQEKAHNAEAPTEEKKKMIDKLEEVVEANNPDRDTKVEDGVTNLQKKPLAPLKGAKVEGARSLTKLTSVSARTLSPLYPGTGPTKPFNYSAKPLDWTLGPIPSIEKKLVLKPVTPTHSEKASTLLVTIPSVMSPDRMSLVTSVTPMQRSPCPPCRAKSPHQLSSVHSSLAAEENPIHAISPSLSANAPLTPVGTPAPVHKEASFSSVTSKTSTNNQFENHTHGSLPKTPVNTPFHAENQQTPEPILGTIQERTISPSIIDNVKNHSDKQQQSPVPLISNNRSWNISPWEESNTIAAQPSEKINASPVPVVTPALTGMTTPDLWPSVDEHAYLDSPEKLVEEILAPAAPPPSPEPVDIEQETDSTDERQEIPKSVVTTSLTPLQEEEEEEEVAKETEVIVNEIKRDESEESVTEQPITTEIGYDNGPDSKEAKNH
ncbi:uncharacterized protein LOC117102832 isoform X2 [Anneissia japonica]|uniref:uncharacterized protein LOC117102832 isoform X2 n=1 Tax=Anneissia japonica TaxID=1529436 RepID=UPI0014258B8B|nr:uncharacterized protein LOC117102832 isoform X2 [Anneissia japonica]